MPRTSINLGGKHITIVSRLSGPISVCIQDLHLHGGKAEGVNAEGGAVEAMTLGAAAQPTELSLLRCHIEGCTSRSGGGAIAGYNSMLWLSHCVLRNNKAAQSGGAVKVFKGNASLLNCVLDSNSAATDAPEGNPGGGAIDAVASTLTLDGCSVMNNRAGSPHSSHLKKGGFGAGIRFTHQHDESKCSTVKLRNTIINNNSAQGNHAGGGGLYVRGDCTTVIDTCTVGSNTASSHGGGILGIGGSLTLTNCVLSSNSAMSGGGIHLEEGKGKAKHPS